MKNLLVTMAITFITSAALANADVQITVCENNPKASLVEITGESALNIFRNFSNRVGMKPADIFNFESNDMKCDGQKFSKDGDVQKAKCSFLMIGSKNFAYPETDSGYSGKKPLICN